MPVDVLQYDDGIVHNPADGYRQTSQGHDVDRDPGHQHQDQGGHDRYRDADRRDEGGAQAQQEDEDRQDREQGPETALANEAVARLDDEGRRIGHGVDFEAAVALSVELVQLRLDGLNGADGVGVGGLGDAEYECRAGVGGAGILVERRVPGGVDRNEVPRP